MTCLNCDLNGAYQAIDKHYLRKILAHYVRAYRKLSDTTRLDTITTLINSLRKAGLL